MVAAQRRQKTQLLLTPPFWLMPQGRPWTIPCTGWSTYPTTTRATVWWTRTNRWQETCLVTFILSTWGPWWRHQSLAAEMGRTPLIKWHWSSTDRASHHVSDLWAWPAQQTEERSQWTNSSLNYSALTSSKCHSHWCTTEPRWRNLSRCRSNPWKCTASYWPDDPSWKSLKDCSGSANFRVAEEVKEPHILCSSQFKCFLVFSSGFPFANHFFLVFLGKSRYFPWQIKVLPLANQFSPVFLEEISSFNCHHWSTNKQTCPCLKPTKLLIFWNVKILPLTSYSFLFVRYCKAQKHNFECNDIEKL